MIAAEGILTARGGVSSHAALVARQMGKVCVCGAAAVVIDYDKKTVTIDGQTFKEGDFLSIDGTSGIVYGGQIKTAPSEIIAGLLNGDKAAQATEKFKSFHQLMKWCAKATRLQVRTNADTPEQTQNAIAFGATGIGLTRTEHMFFEGDRIDAMREMILADNLADRKKGPRQAPPLPARGLLRHLQGAEGLPGHHPLPRSAAARVPASLEGAAARPRRRSWASRREDHARVHELHEFNPMLGFRGCRLGIVSGDHRMQARAVFEAAADVAEGRIKAKPEVMIPLVGFKKELDLQVEIVHEVAGRCQKEKKVKLSYSGRHHDRVPRGALTADEIAQTAEFFSFGTNDLTQTASACRATTPAPSSRLHRERDREEEPVRLDRPDRRRPADADRRSRRAAATVAPRHQARHLRRTRRRSGFGQVLPQARPDLRQSCSPFRVPVARLAAAQAASRRPRAPCSNRRSTRCSSARSPRGKSA
jgi:pyruvate,orthophosphate dikinase